MKKLTSLMVLMGSACVMSSALAANPAKVMVMLAPGFEEGETVEILDVLRRGGFHVDSVSIAGEQVRRCAQNHYQGRQGARQRPQGLSGLRYDRSAGRLDGALTT